MQFDSGTTNEQEIVAFEACRTGDLEQLRSLLSRDDVLQPRLALMQELDSGSWGSVPGRLSTAGRVLYQMFELAVQNCQPDILEHLLTGFRPQHMCWQVKDTWTLIHDAACWCKRNGAKLTDLLLTHIPEQLGYPDRDNLRPLECVVRSSSDSFKSREDRMGRIEVLDVLIKHGADINELDTDRDDFGQTHTPGALYSAVKYSFPEMVEAMEARGGDFSKIRPLYLAVSSENEEVVRYLLSRSRGEMRKENASIQPCQGWRQGSQEEIPQIKSEGTRYTGIPSYCKQAELNDPSSEQRASGGNDPAAREATPLHIAAAMGSEKMAGILLESGADPNIASRDFGQPDPFTYFEELVRARDKGVWDINREKVSGTPLHAAATMGVMPLVKMLLKAGADKTTRNLDGKLALDLAREYGREDVVGFLEATSE